MVEWTENTDVPPAAQAAMQPAADPPIRIGIGHLMLWTAGSAVLLAVQQFYRSNNLPEELRGITVFGQLIYALANGAALGGLVVLVHRKWKGLRFPISPGHWVLVVSGGVTLAGGAITLLTTPLRELIAAGMFSLTAGRVTMLLYVVYYLASAIMYALLLRLPLPPRWKMYALCRAGYFLCYMPRFLTMFLPSMSIRISVIQTISYAPLIIALGQFVALMFCLVHDLRDENRYDPLHWAGWAVAMVGAAMHWYWWAANWVIYLSEVVVTDWPG